MNEEKKQRPTTEYRKIIKMGAYTRGITLPSEWFNIHGIDPDILRELLIIVDQDIRIVNPEFVEAAYRELRAHILLKIKLSEIKRDKDIYPRQKISKKTVESYVEALKATERGYWCLKW